MSALFTFVAADLYEGNYASASDRIERDWRAMEDSFLLRIEFSRQDCWYLRGRSALALSAVAPSPERERRRRIVKQALRALERDAVVWAAGFALVLRAGDTELDGDVSLAAELLGQATRAFEQADLRLFALACALQAARLRGDSYRDYEQRLLEAGVQEPLRFANVLVPTRSGSIEHAATSGSVSA